MTTVEFGGVVFNDEAWEGFTLSRLVGWSDAAPTRYDAQDRPQANGSFRPGTIYRGARVVSVEGSWLGDSLEDAYGARELLAGLQANGQESVFSVSDLLGDKWITAGLSTAPTMDDGLYQPFFKFAFDVIAADPFKYGQAVVKSTKLASLPAPPDASALPSGGLYPSGQYTPVESSPGLYSTDGLQPAGDGLYTPLAVQPPSGGGLAFPVTFPITFGAPASDGRITIVNDGTAETYPTFTVTGGRMPGGFTLVDVRSGSRITVTRDLLASNVVTVTPRTGTVLLDGSPIPGFVTRAEWWSIPPRSTSQVQFLANGDVTGVPVLTASTAPAFL